MASPLYPDLIVFHWGLLQEVAPPSASCAAVGSPRKCSILGSRVSGGPQIALCRLSIVGGLPHPPPYQMVLLRCWLWVFKGNMPLWHRGAGTRGLGLPALWVPLAISPSRGLRASLASSSQLPLWMIPAMGALVVTLLHPCSQLTQSFDLLSQQVGSHQHPPMGLPGLSELMAIGVILWSSLGDPISVVGQKGAGGSPL